jgi:predicted nucleic acid-binding protein
VKLFLDTSVLLAACGSARGASRALFHLAPNTGWTLVTSPYAICEVIKNLPKFPAAATSVWVGLRRQLTLGDDVVALNRPAVFPVSKDRPILFSALAWSQVLLTLDREDFVGLLGGQFYGLRIRLPFEFLEEERAAGRLLFAGRS